MTSFLDLSKKTKEEIKKLKKPLSAYQYYIKDMREKWNNLNDAEKEKYLFQAQQDNQRYEKEKMEIKEIEKSAGDDELYRTFYEKFNLKEDNKAIKAIGQ